MPRDDWARAKRREAGEREARRLEREEYRRRKRATAKRLKKQSQGVVIHSKKDSVASQAKGPQGDRSKVIELPLSRKGTIFEPMICMDCETVWTTDDPHIRDRGRVLCVKCKGMLTLLHQYEEMRDELDAGLKQVLETTT